MKGKTTQGNHHDTSPKSKYHYHTPEWLRILRHRVRKAREENKVNGGM